MTKLAKLIKRKNLLPGDVVNDTFEWSESTTYRYLQNGWLEERGFLVLTTTGYVHN